MSVHNEARIQGIVWEFVHDGENVDLTITGSIAYQAAVVAYSPVFNSGSIGYQSAEVAFSPIFDSGSVGYQSAEVAFSPIFDSGSVAYQSAEVAFSPIYNSGSIGYQSAEIAFSPTFESASIAYQAVQVAFRQIVPSASISYQAVQVAYTLTGLAQLYGSISEVGWMFNYSNWPPVEPIPYEECGVLVNPDFSLNTYGLRTLSCERVKAPGVEQVPFRLAHKTDLGLRRLNIEQDEGGATLYGTVIEAGWLYRP